MRLFRRYIILIIMLLGHCVAYSQESTTEVFVDFRVNLIQIDPGYRGNQSRLDELVSILHQLQEDSTINIVSVAFRGAASPEGSYEWNTYLADARLKALERMVRSRVHIPDSIISYDNSYIPWDQLVSQLAEADIERKDEILSIISQPAEIVDYYGGRRVDSRILKLQKLEGGRLWKQMLRRYFAPLRNASVAITTVKQQPIHATIEPIRMETQDIVTKPVAMKPFVPIAVPLPDVPQWEPKLYVKTNALALGLAIANAGVEVDLARNWSFNLPVYYSAWDYFSSTVKFRTFAFQPEVRYWLSPNTLCNDGWFVGAHFGFAYYNLATNSDFRRQDRNGTTPAIGGGINLGYRKPISADKRWKMEFSLGAGVYPLHYDQFHNYRNGLLWSTVKKTYFGLDQATLSFSYTFDLKKKTDLKSKGKAKETDKSDKEKKRKGGEK